MKNPTVADKVFFFELLVYRLEKRIYKKKKITFRTTEFPFRVNESHTRPLRCGLPVPPPPTGFLKRKRLLKGCRSLSADRRNRKTPVAGADEIGKAAGTTRPGNNTRGTSRETSSSDGRRRHDRTLSVPSGPADFGSPRANGRVNEDLRDRWGGRDGLRTAMSSVLV